jgi:hypothetical protein
MNNLGFNHRGEGIGNGPRLDKGLLMISPTLTLDEGRSECLNPAQAEEFDRQMSALTGSRYERLFFGMTLREALGRGYRITRRGYKEATESPAAIATTRHGLALRGAPIYILFSKRMQIQN